MAFSKKKQRNWRKAESRVGPKAKGKVKKARQIEGRQQLRASKRKAAEATGRGKDSEGRAGKPLEGDALTEIKSVDALFASMGGEEGDASSDESSAGAFHDVGGFDDDGPAFEGVREDPDEDEGLGSDAGARHAKELRAIREKDPEFYKFLVEQDRGLLDFSVPDEPEGGDDEEVPEEGKQAPVPQGKVLTRERLERIQASAGESFTACKAILNAYHTAVRSIEEQRSQADAGAESEDGEVDKKGKHKKHKEKSAAAQRRVRRSTLRIEDEAIFSEVIEWSIANMLGLLRHHAGELQAEARGSGRNRRKPQKGSPPSGAGARPGPLDPARYKRWPRVRVLALIFWEETVFLLSHLVAQPMVEYVLRNCSTPEALSWLWPFRSLRQRYIKRCCSLWSTAGAHNVRVLAFLFLRNSAAMVLHAPDLPTSEAQQLEALLRAVLRAFAEVASRGYSWRSLSTFRFMENCLIELLRLHDATAYRLGYVCLRQLALILRNSSLAMSQGSTAAKAKGGSGPGEKGKKKGAAQQQAQSLIAWPFVRAVCLWTRAIGALPSLRPLAYPLSMITLGAVKSKLTSLQHFPFVYHCLFSLNRLGASLEVFVPISSHLLKALTVLLQAMDKAHRKGPKGGEQRKTLDSSVKAPDLEILLRLSEGQLVETLVLEAAGSSLCFLLIDHLGLLSQSPAFPELITPLMLHLRRHGKHCRSEPLRRQLRSLVERAEATAEALRARREALTEAPDFKKFLIFEPDTPMAKARAEALKRRAAEERGRVEAELREEASGGPAKGAIAAGEGLENVAAKKKRKSQKARLGKLEEEKERKRKQGGVAAEARAAGALPDRDKVEDMDFSSGAEE